ncbi:MAG: hypothetical protein MK214_02330 [Thalassotalea sp.]|nr:hypothetical protein [Thalassotalea sp.]
MLLSKKLQNGNILYYVKGEDGLSVYENRHMRWMAFGDVLQSVIRKHKPHQLTLPHQWAMTMPLLTLTPKTVVEFGLGAGNQLLFTQSLAPNIHHKVIEANGSVLEAAVEYFPVSKLRENLIHIDAKAWIDEQSSLKDDWYIFDIYHKTKFADNSYNDLLENVIARLPDSSILTINFPETTEKEIKFWLLKLIAKQSHVAEFYSVPHYKNHIIHLMPRNPGKTIKLESALPKQKLKYWQSFQRQFGLKVG